MELPLLIREIIEHPLAACTVATLIGGFYWQVFEVVAALKKATFNELPHIQSATEEIALGIRDLVKTMGDHDQRCAERHTAEMLMLTALIKK